MPKLSTDKIKPQKKLFHNEHVNVYPRVMRLSAIKYWPKNNRTIFTFERLEKQNKKKIEFIPIEEITQFIADQDMHKLPELAKSIGRNGVQVPLIISDDGKLLDGNRRFFACHWLRIQALKQGKPLPKVLSEIPVLIIRTEDLEANPRLELKILAEVNFIQDLKVTWPLDAQARAVEAYYSSIRKNKTTHEKAIEEVVEVFGITKSKVIEYLDVLALTEAFISIDKDPEERMRRRQIVEDKFVYLWEFRNKATTGRGALEEPLLQEVKDVFFALMSRGKDSPIKNVKQIEAIVQARRDKTAWKILIESKGTKLSTVVALIRDKKEIRAAEDKIRIFHDWLDDEVTLSDAAKNLLEKLAVLVKSKAKS